MDRVSDPDEAQRLALGVRNFDFDSFLGPYPDEQADSWTRLTYLVTAGVLERSKVSSGQVQNLNFAPSRPTTIAKWNTDQSSQPSIFTASCF